MTAGGKRKGAGRPSLHSSEKAVAVTVRVRPYIAARFSAWCIANSISQARAFAAWVRRLQYPNVSYQPRPRDKTL